MDARGSRHRGHADLASALGGAGLRRARGPCRATCRHHESRTDDAARLRLVALPRAAPERICGPRRPARALADRGERTVRSAVPHRRRDRRVHRAARRRRGARRGIDHLVRRHALADQRPGKGGPRDRRPRLPLLRGTHTRARAGLCAGQLPLGERDRKRCDGRRRARAARGVEAGPGRAWTPVRPRSGRVDQPPGMGGGPGRGTP